MSNRIRIAMEIQVAASWVCSSCSIYTAAQEEQAMGFYGSGNSKPRKINGFILTQLSQFW
jgi:hypothetical protein